MTISLKHTTQAAGTDAGNGEIRKAQWNEEHALTMATGKLLGRSTAGTGAAEEITVGAGLSLSGGSLTASASAPEWGEIGGTLADQTDLQDALDGKSDDGHGHAISDVTGLQTALDGKAASSHTHTASDVTSDIVSETADFTFALTDANDTVSVSSASAVVALIPTNAAVAFPIGTRIRVFRAGTGTVKVSPDSGVTLRLPTGIKPKRFMGALVKKSGDETAANYSGGVALGWDAEVYDTDGFHDNVTNNSRLTVASGLGITKVRFGGHVRIQNLIANDWVQLAVRKAGSLDFDGLSALFSETDNTGADVIISSSPISVSGGDYFEEYLTVQGDTSIDIIAARSSFSIEVTEIDAQGFVAYQYGAIEIQKVGTNEWIVTDQSALG